MRNGCLPNLRNIYFWKRKSKKEGRIAVKAMEVSKVKTEECWVREDAADKYIHVQRDAVNKNSGLLEKEGTVTETKKILVDEKVDDILALDERLTLVDIEKDEKSNEKLTVERGLEKVDVNCIHTEQDLTQDQANPRQEEKGAIAPKTDDWNKVKTFDLRGLKGRGKIDSGFNKVKTFVSRGVKVRENTANGFNKVKTFDLRGVKSNGKGRKATAIRSRIFSVK
ncbi:hypothetical protein N665_0224s0010 [Sinapis alba]|nr:hypothetical protein N665_0224s0010 [Sinapis alba]